MNKWKLEDAKSQREIIKQVINIIWESSGDGTGIIVCKYIDENDVVEYVKNLTGWKIVKDKHSVLLGEGQEWVIVITMEEFIGNTERWCIPEFHDVFVFI